MTDGLCILSAFSLAYLARFGASMPTMDFILVIALAPPLWLGVFAAHRLYGISRFAPAEEFRRLLTAITIGITLVVALSFWSHSSFSRLWLALVWLFSAVLVLASRRVWHGWLGRQKERGAFTFRTLIAGTNDEARRIARTMTATRQGYLPLGFVSTGNGAATIDGLPVVGSMSSLHDSILKSEADCLFVASTAVSAEQMERIVKSMRRDGIEVRVSANLPEMLTSRVVPQPVGGIMTLALRPVELSGPQAFLKRSLDLVGSAVGLIVTLPLFAAIAIAIEFSSRGSVFFRQERVGRHGKPFTMIKFRTMVSDAEERLADLHVSNEASGPLFKMKNDPRVTRLGRRLRRWSLDELPQLVNVLKGEMSLVGPRPSLPNEVTRYEDWEFDRLEVRPGITGLWQVSGRSDLVFADYVRLDLFYIENWSLAYDLFILVKTIPAVFSQKGSY